MLILVVVGFLGKQLQDIEDKLDYEPPVSHSHKSDGNEISIEKGRTVYVPAYSHVYSGSGEPQLLAITLSIRNTDPEHSIRIVDARYFNTKGELVKNYMEGIVTLAPFETVDILVEKQDRRGGSGANFVVTWKSDEPVYEPVIQAIMIGTKTGQNISFVTSARRLSNRLEKHSD